MSRRPSERDMSDPKRIQMVITECDTTESLRGVDDYSSALGQKMVRAKIHALVPECICKVTPSEMKQYERGQKKSSRMMESYKENECTCGTTPTPCCAEKEEPPSLTEATTQTKETRLVSAAELECLCSGKRAKGFPRDSEEQKYLHSKQRQKNKCGKSKPKKSQPELCGQCQCCQPKSNKNSDRRSLSKGCSSRSKSPSPEPCLESCRGPCNVPPPCCNCGKKRAGGDLPVCPAQQPKQQQNNKQKQQQHQCEANSCPRCKCQHCEQQSKSKCVIQ